MVSGRFFVISSYRMECFLWASHTPVLVTVHQLLGASVGSGTEYAGQDQRAAFKEPTVSLGAVDITME